jgi:hypothetical protein
MPESTRERVGFESDSRDFIDRFFVGERGF